jgi:proteasome lid subunit RPN8/RPN11
MLVLPTAIRDEMVAACLDGYPLEVCGLLGGRVASGQGTGFRDGGPTGGGTPGGHGLPSIAEEEPMVVKASYPANNAAASSRVYTVEPRDLLHADRAAEDAGWSLVGVWHSHTHTDAYPSPTDIAQAPDPDWHYVLISLRDTEPVVRSYRIRDGETEEEPVVLQ